MRGRIKRYFSDKGYGFIAGEDGVDYYFHISNVRTAVQITQGSVVEFDVVRANDKKNNKAVNIKIIEVKDRPLFIEIGNTRLKLSNIKNYGIGRSSEKILKSVKVKTYKRSLNKTPIIKFICKYNYEPAGYADITIEEYNTESRKLRIREINGLSSDEIDLYNEINPKAYILNPNATYPPIIRDDKEQMLHREDFVLSYDYLEYVYITTYQNDNYTFYGSGYRVYQETYKKTFDTYYIDVWEYYKGHDLHKIIQELDSYFTK